jgi:hypothetical protein
MYCRTCRRCLNVHTDMGGRVTYLHTTELRGQGTDHAADPVPLSQFADPIMECDFCSAPHPVFVYRCANQRTDHRVVTARMIGARDYRDRHHAARTRRLVTEPGTVQAWGERWSTCSDCADLIEARDLLGLIRRVVDAMPAKFTRGNRLARVRGELHTTFGNVLDTLAPGRGRITPGNPLGLWECEPTRDT